MSDAVIIERLGRRAESGETITAIAEAAGISRPTLSVWARRKENAVLIEQHKQLAKLEAKERERDEAERVKQASKRKRKPAKPKPDPVPEWDGDPRSYPAYVEECAKVGRGARVGRVIQW